ncbi:MAG: hypothetical protein GY711_21420 [bacterium]|nr:hypothetical protein [bacterium]
MIRLGNGQLCIGSTGLHRFLPGTTTSGTRTYGPGLGAHANANFGPAGAIEPGTMWNFQVWYRDAGGPCGENSNLTNAVAVHFVL